VATGRSDSPNQINTVPCFPFILIPKPFDLRLIVRVAPAVARAAIDSGVATTDCQLRQSYFGIRAVGVQTD
jgi:malic enzyme